MNAVITFGVIVSLVGVGWSVSADKEVIIMILFIVYLLMTFWL